MPRGWFSGPGIGVLDTRYLRLNAVNDPVTAGLEINAATAAEPVLILQTTDDDATNPILEIQNAAGNMLSELEKDGNWNFTTALAANPGMLEVNGARLLHLYGLHNVFVGPGAGNFTLTGGYNVGLGGETLSACTTGEGNMALGFRALLNNTSGHRNMAIGAFALQFNTTANNNVAIGNSALGSNITGAGNVALGMSALDNSVTGNDNVAVGGGALHNQNGASSNVGVGVYTNSYNVTGTANTCVGTFAGWGGGVAGQSHSRDTFIGYEAGSSITTGSYNVCIGFRAGNVLSTGAYNVIIGYDVDPTGAAVSNELNIGALIYGKLDTNRGGVNVTPPSLAAAWHVDQPTNDAAIPVLLLDQADVDQDMIEFVCTIAVGNAIEAVGAKTLTTTHFIKVTLPGPLTRYIPVGTIA